MSGRSDQIGKHDSKNNAAATEAWAKERTIVDGRNNFPKLHNAMWPGVVGKGPDSEPPIGLDEMLDLTAAAGTNDTKFDGVDLFLADPHTSIDSSSDDIKRLSDKIAVKNFEVGSVVAPVWPPLGGGSAIGSEGDRRRFVEMVRKACRRSIDRRHWDSRPTWRTPSSTCSATMLLKRASCRPNSTGTRKRSSIWH